MRTRTLLKTLLLLTLCGLPTLALAQDGGTLTVEDAEGPSGGTAQTSVTVTNASDIGAFDLALAYDPAVLRFLEAEAGASADNAMMTWNEIEPGRLLVAMADVDGLAGDGPVLIVTFEVTGAVGDRSTVAIEAVQAYHYDSLIDIPLTTVDGEVTVVAGALPLLPIPIGLVLLALIVLVVVVVVVVVLLLRRSKTPSRPARPSGPRVCPRCGQTAGPGVPYCIHCGESLE